MKPRHLIEATANDGISLALTSNGDLVVTSAKEAIEAWREHLLFSASLACSGINRG